jgi:NAD(P)-dependent dehydrogenase (short-subunit alcohol dehydrogenase family)
MALAPPSGMSMHGKVAIVTGAASGIGRATAAAFGREGARVVCVDRDPKVEELAGLGMHVVADVSRSADVAAMVGRAVDAFGGIDYAFNNAGTEGASGTTGDYDEAEWNRVIATNLTGVWLCMKHEIARMRGGRGGVIVNCASIAGLIGFTEEPAYVASKHGIVGLTKVAALELAREKIRVNCVCPGAIDTPMLARSTEPGADYGEREPIGRIGRPEEIADAVLWLCSDRAAFVTGIALPVDGGWVAGERES